MKDLSHILKKQKQLCEIEIGELKLSRTFGHPPIHPEIYYAKIAHVWQLLNKATKLLDSTENDIYENYNFKEQ